MKTQQEIEQLTENTLNSLDGLKPLEANPYLYAKILNRMGQARQATAKHARLMFRLSMALLLILFINIGSFFMLNKFQQQPVPHISSKGKMKPTTGISTVGEEFFPKAQSYSY